MSDQQQPQQIEQEKPGDDLRSALLSSVAEVEAKTPGSTGRLADVAPKSEPASGKPVAETPDAEKQNVSPASGERGPDGKFLPKKDATAAPDKAAGEQKTTDSAKSAQTGTEAAKADAAPATWRAEAKAAWQNLPEPARKILGEEIAKRERDFAQGIEAKTREFQQVKSQFDEIEQAIGPRRAAWQATQGGVGAALKQLLAYSDFAGSDPAGFIAEFSHRMGVDLNALLTGQPAAQQAAAGDPAMRAEINGLKSQLQQLQGGMQNTQVASIKSEFDAFENEKDQTTGEDAHPFYRDVRDSGHLMPEIQLVKAEHPEWSPRQVISEAYDRTVHKLSDVRTRMQSLQDQRAQAEQEKATRAAAASNARKFVNGSAPGPQAGAAAPANSLRDEIAANFYALQGGASRL